MESLYELTPQQEAILALPLDQKIFLTGPAGSGKTTVGVTRLLSLIAQSPDRPGTERSRSSEQALSSLRHAPADSILLLFPQRTLAAPYYAALKQVDLGSHAASIVTTGGLARRMAELFWPLVSEAAGFTHPERLPVFLTLETTQYYMGQIVDPLLAEGHFQSIVINPNRLYSQIIDNLNKSAVVGFPIHEIAERLKTAWVGDAGQLNIYEDAQLCATSFREYCLANNLLDYSLQIELFWRFLWPHPLCREYLTSKYRHLICDNLEEDVPVTHDLLEAWLPEFDSALLIYDEQGGYRRFLGADPLHAARLSALCSTIAHLEESLVMSSPMSNLCQQLGYQIAPNSAAPEGLQPPIGSGQEGDPLQYEFHRFFPSMLDWTVDKIEELITEGTPPGEIVVLAPFLSDAMRFSLSYRLQNRGIPVRSHRPSRSLREEPITECLLTLALLAHPDWLRLAPSLAPTKFDLAYTLVQAIEDMDLVRAQLLSEIVLRNREGLPSLSSFDQIRPDIQERITYQLGERFELLRHWLVTYQQNPPDELDHFLSRLFGELLSQPGFGFHHNYPAGEITANLMESIQKFRWVAAEYVPSDAQPFPTASHPTLLSPTTAPLGLKYLETVRKGILAAQYIRSWVDQPEEAVFLSPAYTFLMSNRPVSYQFWLDAASRGWAERLYQPLTHPYVLSRQWETHRRWTDIDEVQTNQQTMYTLVVGLLRRCRHKLFLGLSDLGEQGYQQRGDLLRAIQRTLQAMKSASLDVDLMQTNG